jgi:hypothetical protein
MGRRVEIAEAKFSETPPAAREWWSRCANTWCGCASEWSMASACRPVGNRVAGTIEPECDRTCRIQKIRVGRSSRLAAELRTIGFAARRHLHRVKGPNGSTQGRSSAAARLSERFRHHPISSRRRDAALRGHCERLFASTVGQLKWLVRRRRYPLSGIIETGEGPLHLAALGGNLESVRFLIKHGGGVVRRACRRGSGRTIEPCATAASRTATTWRYPSYRTKPASLMLFGR